MWKQNPNDKSTEYHASLIYQEDWCEGDDHWTEATVKKDGCIHFYEGNNAPMGSKYPERSTEDDNYIHICELDDFIKQLQELREAAIAYFGKEWSNQ